MAVRWYVVTATDTTVEITDRVRKPDIGGSGGFVIGANADEGSGGSFTLNVDDPDADLHLLNHRRVYAIAEDAPAGHQRVGNWWISDLDVIRGLSDKTGASRTWILQIEDENSIIPRKIFNGVDVDRPVETDIERIDWWMTTTEGSVVKDDLYLDRTEPKDLDASDLTGQTADTLLSGCKDASGKNYFIWFNELAIAGTIVSSSVANPTVITTSAPHDLLDGAQVTISGHTGSTPDINGVHTITLINATTFSIPVNVTVGGTGGTVVEPRYSIAYFDFGTYANYTSSIRLSNLLAEIDNSTTFAIADGDKTRLNRAGRRIASGNFKPFDGGNVYVQDPAVAALYVSRDVSTPAINTKSLATATTEATRQLGEMDEPDDQVETEFYVKEAQINAAMHGMLIPFRATHFPNYTPTTEQPGYSAMTNMRIMKRTVTQVSPEKFVIHLWLTPTLSPVDVSGILYRNESTGNNPGPQLNQIYWDSSGDLPDSGFPPSPTVGPIHILDGPHVGAKEWAGFGIDGTGTVDLVFGPHTEVAGVPLNGDEVTIYLALNGTAIPGASYTLGPCVASPAWPAGTNDVGITVTGLAVVPGDEITAWLTVPGAHGNFGVPQGSAVQGQNFTITGSLVA